MFEAAELAALGLSLRVALVASLAALPPALAIAWVLARCEFRGKLLLDAFVHLPLVLPPVVTGYLLLLAFGRQGWIGSWLDQCCGLVFAFRWTGAALAAAVMAFPLMVRSMRLSLEAVDPRLEQAAASLGAPAVAVFWRVTLPLCWPGVLAGLVLAFAKALGEFGATITFVASIPGQTQTLALTIYQRMQIPGAETQLWRLAALSVVVSMAALLASEWLARRQRVGP
ncbi:MAG: molybdate ABC transporter permease subunit [Lysobacterales bacterium]